MSTSSGRKGWCKFCGHALNGHAKINESKCKKCKKPFEICQAMVHGPGNTIGYMICSRPCSCGPSYYPDKAVHATDLPREAWATSHPGYVPPDDSTVVYDDSVASASCGNEEYTQHARPRTLSSESGDPLSGQSTSAYQRTASVPGLRGDVQSIPVTNYADELLYGHEEDTALVRGEDLSGLSTEFGQLQMAESAATNTNEAGNSMVEVVMHRNRKRGEISFEDPETQDKVTFKEGALKFDEEHGYHYFWYNNTYYYTYPAGKGKGKETIGSSSQGKRPAGSGKTIATADSSSRAKKSSKSKPKEHHPDWAYVDNVIEKDWTIFDTDKSKRRDVLTDESGYLYVEKKDGSWLYLQY
jgi:hypothetical protein